MNQITVIPKPNKVALKESRYCFKAAATIAGDFSGALHVFLSVFPASHEIVNEKPDVLLQAGSGYAPEAYSLQITGKQIIIKASGETGAFYAIQTLRQMVAANEPKPGSDCFLPVCEIEDEPRFAYRGFMLDEARHFWGKEFVKKTLDIMALLKLNTFHWHLTDDQGWRIEIKKYPLLTEKGSIRQSTQLNMLGLKRDKTAYGKGLFYSQEDIKEIVQYAKDLHINIIPEIDMPGHLTAAIACYPELSCSGKSIMVGVKWGVIKTIGCCGKEQIYTFSKDIIDELTTLFPYKIFHIGGDEAPKNNWKTCPDCQKKIRALHLKNENALQAHFSNEMEKYLKTKGKMIQGWNEILASDVLSDSVIAQWWTGNIKKSGVERWLEKGNNVVLSQVQYLYMDHFYARKDLRKTYSLDLDALKVPQKYEHQILGIEAPHWTEYVRNELKFNFNTYPRMQALSEINWTNRKNKDFDDFQTRLPYFSRILESRGITGAPASAYLLSGVTGFLRKAVEQAEWLVYPNFECMKYTKKQKKKGSK